MRRLFNLLPKVERVSIRQRRCKHPVTRSPKFKNSGTDPNGSVSAPTVIVMDLLTDDASSGLKSTRQLPSAFTTPSADWLATFTVTASPGLPHPQIGTAAPRCKTIPSLITAGKLTSAHIWLVARTREKTIVRMVMMVLFISDKRLLRHGVE